MIFGKKKNKLPADSLSNKALQIRIAQKIEMEHAMLGIADKFKSPDRFDSALQFALEQLVKISGCDRAIIMQITERNTLAFTHEAIRGIGVKVSRFLKEVPYELDPWMRDANIGKKYVAVTDTWQLPAEAERTKSNFARARARAFLSTSFSSNYKFKGNLSLMCKKPIEGWSEETCTLVVFVSTLIEQMLERKEAEARLVEERNRAEQTDKLKAAFIANMSHEIRTPLNSIVGFSQLLASNQLPPERKTRISKVLTDNTSQLLSVMDDLMDAAQIQAESIELHKEGFPIKSIELTLTNHYKEEIVNRGNVNFSVSISPELENKFLYTDKNRFLQVIDYIIKNAVKFTDDGTISVEIKRSKYYLEVHILDTGIGIAKEHFEKIFERFWQVDPSNTRKYGGNGLGLSIAQDLAVLLKGNISVHSEIGEGSCFTFNLPKSAITDEAPKHDKKPQERKKLKRKALIADDFTSIHEYILNILEPEGFACTFANDGMEAMELVKEIKFDLILLDIQMPYFDGIEVMKHIKDLHIEAPVIAKTAHSTQEDADKFLSEGFDGFLAKPFRPGQLVDLVHKCFPEDSLL